MKRMRRHWFGRLLLIGCLILTMEVSTAHAIERLSMSAVMSPKEAMKYDFPTASRHFVLLVRREGTVAGNGIWNHAKAVEYGMHDIQPGNEGLAQGYLILTLSSGDHAIIKWQVQATFVPGPGGKPKLLDNGIWRFVVGTGALKGLKGAGIMHINPVSPKDRKFSFEGRYVVLK